MQTIEKIFVEPDDEIIFIVEKIIKAPTSKVILVIPATSAVVSSVISLKLLSRQILDSNKVLVLVTDNPTGKRLAEKANLIIRDKISLVDKLAWDEAMTMKKSLSEHKDEIKQELLSSRIPEEVEDELVKEEIEVTKNEAPKEAVTEVRGDPQIEEVDLPDPQEVFAEKSRLQPKLLNVRGIAIASGGDIATFKDEIDKTEEIEKPLPIVSKVTEAFVGKVKTPFKSSSPNKQDLSKVNERRLNKLNPKKKSKVKKLLLILAILAGIVLLGILGFFFYSYKTASVDIDVSFNQSEGSINQVITISTIATTIDSENLVMPGFQINIEDSSSGDTIATGKKKTGEFAQGVIDIRNKSTESAVNLSQGQIIVDISSNLQYELTQNVTIPVDQYQRDVSIKAKNFGEEYNIENEQSTFRIEGFTTDKLIGFGFRDVTGGKTEDITVVSKEDVAKIKKDLETAIKGNLQTRLKSQLSEGEIMLEGSEKFDEVSFDQSIQVDEQAENFSINLKMKATAIKVKEKDVQALAQEIIKKSERATAEAEVKVDDFQVKNVKVDGEKISFELIASGEVNESLKLEEQKSKIVGKTISETEAYLESLEQIDQVTVTYKPDFIPERFRKIPSNTSKIEFK